MAKLYENVVHPADLKEVGKTLFQVLTDKEKPCVVHRFVEVDMSHVDYDLHHSPIPMSPKRAKSGRIKTEELAVNYVGIAEGYPTIVDHENARHFEIDSNERRVLVIGTALPNAFYHARIASSRGGNYIYKGILFDALKEFQDYRFYETELTDLKTLVETGKPYVPTKEIRDIGSLVISLPPNHRIS